MPGIWPTLHASPRFRCQRNAATLGYHTLLHVPLEKTGARMPSRERREAENALRVHRLNARTAGFRGAQGSIIAKALSGISIAKLRNVEGVRGVVAAAHRLVTEEVVNAEKSDFEVCGKVTDAVGVLTTARRALSKLESFGDAQKVLDDARATLERLRDDREAIKEYEKLNGGPRRTPRGKVVHKSGAAIKKGAADRRKARRDGRNFKGVGRSHSAVLYDLMSKESHEREKHRGVTSRRLLRRRLAMGSVVEDEELERYVKRVVRGPRGNKKVKYEVASCIKPPGCTESNAATTLAKANARSRRWQKMRRDAGLSRSKEEQEDTGRPTGVEPQGDGKWVAKPHKRSGKVWLRAPDGGKLFDTTKAAGDAIEAWKAAGSPSRGPLVFKGY